MRSAYSYEIIIENGHFVGFKLGRGYAAEQEHGIDELKGYFKVDDSFVKLGGLKKRFGLERRMVKEVPPTLRIEQVQTEYSEGFGIDAKSWYETEYVLLVTDPFFYHLSHQQHGFELPIDLKPGFLTKEKKDFRMAWSESDFGILTNEENLHYLETLLDAFKRKDVALHYTGAELFILIASRIPEEDKKTLIEVDKALYREKA